MKPNQEQHMSFKNIVKCISLFSIAMVLCLAGPTTAIADTIGKNIYQTIDKQFIPALCRINYATEITNASSGETNRRSTYTMGIMVSNDGLIMAHGHMQLENRTPKKIKVTVGAGDDEKEYGAIMLKKPDDINVVFLKIQTEEKVNFPYISFKNSPFDLGDPILTVGLLNQNFDYGKIIRAYRIGSVITEPRVTYAVDNAVNFGFIGGPVVNANGHAIGVIGYDLSDSEGGDIYTRSGYPLVYQTSLFKKYIDNPPSEEELNSNENDAYLGVFSQPLTEEYAEYWKLPNEGGIIVSTVIPGSPAYKAGFKMGDIIRNFNGTPVTAQQDQDVVSFTKLVRESTLNEPLSVLFYRDGKQQEIKLTLTTRPTAGRNAAEYEDTVFGITARDLTTDVKIALNLSDDVQGVIITRVKSGSDASLARLRRNFVIQRMGNISVNNIEEFKKAIETLSKDKPQEIPIFCRVGPNTAFFRIQPRWKN